MNSLTNNPSVSFIIPHRGRTDLLKETLKSIDYQLYDHSKIQVFVITQDDVTLVKPILLDINIPVSIVHHDSTSTISALRNKGAQLSESMFLAFLDADICLSKNWTSEMIQTHSANQEIVCLSSIQVENENPTIVEKIRTKMASCSRSGYVESLPGANLFLTKEIFQKTGGFPENLTTCEDIFFTSSLTQLGKLFITDSASFIHLGEDKTYSQVMKKELWRAKSNLLSLKNRKVPLRELPSIILPFWFLTSIVILLYSFFIRAPFITLISLLMYLIPVILYSFRAKLKTNISFFHYLLFYIIYHTARTFGATTVFLQPTSVKTEKKV
jgi:hypothetical protein